MSHFLGTHQNRLDAKGRVSVPAPFRAALRTEEADSPITLILRPSHKFPCIEGWPVPKFEALANSLGKLAQFSDTFQIWEPAAGSRRRTEARSGARLRELSLPGAAA